ncbi:MULTISPECIES: hypothetical protein [Halomonas]|uniref:hypothetical protein n=1 Tax=Halomonas TaxID=2745 RepID=UPI0018662DF0|nr:hypothetical protein [Halomonas citrativorans]
MAGIQFGRLDDERAAISISAGSFIILLLKKNRPEQLHACAASKFQRNSCPIPIIDFPEHIPNPITHVFFLEPIISISLAEKKNKLLAQNDCSDFFSRLVA